METPVRTRVAALILAYAVLPGWPGAANAADSGPRLEPYQAKYHVHSSGFRAGEIVSTLREEGAEYVFETRGKSRGLATFFVPRQALEVSRFRVSEDGLVSLSYLRDAGKADPRDDTRAEFDWANGTVATVDKGREAILELAPGMIERHILPLAIGLGLHRGAPPPSLTLIERDRIKVFDITPQGADRIELGGGVYETVKFLQHRDESDRSTTIWFAPDLGFVPVKFEIHDKRGLRARIQLKQLTLDGNAVLED